jgi:hypothetical protein
MYMKPSGISVLHDSMHLNTNDTHLRSIIPAASHSFHEKEADELDSQLASETAQ